MSAFKYKNFNLLHPDELCLAASKAEKENISFFSKLRKVSPRILDKTVQSLHEEISQTIDCLSCAICCKTLGPLLKQKDIDRISKKLKIKSTDFIEKYLWIDEEGDFVFQTTPCPFLLFDNYCSVYEACPKACSEYPHTHQNGIHKILDLTLKNTYFCPIVFQIVEKLKKTGIV